MQESKAGVNDDQLRVGLGDSALFFELLGMEEIVVIEKGDPVAGGVLDGVVAGLRGAEVRLTNIADAVAEGVRDFGGAIG